MSSEKKTVTLEIADGKLLIIVDANKDGQAVLSVSVDLSEVADEVISAIKSVKK